MKHKPSFKQSLKFLTLVGLIFIGSNAWGEKITDYTKLVSGKKYYIGATNSSTDYYFKVASTSTGTGVSGTAVTSKADAVVLTATGSGTSWNFKFDSGTFLSLASSKNNGKVNIVSSAANWTLSTTNSKIRMTINDYALQKNNSGTQFGSYASTQTDVWFEEADAPEATLVSIAISGTPTKTNYDAGQALNPTGLVVTGTYDDESEKTITTGIEWTFDPETLSAGDTQCEVMAAVGEVVSDPITVTGLTVTTPQTYGFTHDFSEISDFSSWGSSYSKHTVSYTNDDVIFVSANKSTSTITDVPVTKGGDIELVLTNKTKAISAVKFECRQWGTKAQTITLNYSTNGGTSYSTLNPSVTSTNFVIECTSLPANTNAVKISFSSTSNQVGIESVSFNLVNKELTSSEVTFTTPENGTLTVKEGDNVLTSGSTVEQYKTVSITATPNDGYKLDALTVKDADENDVTLTETSGVYSFEMPNKAVSIQATFAAAAILQSVEITTPANKTVFWKGESFTAEGLVLTATFSTGTQVVTPTSITGYDMSTVGEQIVTVSFTEGAVTKTATYNITVKSIENTAETAYSTAEAIILIDANPSELTSVEVYVKGMVSKVDSYNSNYNSITYWLDSNTFEIYSGLAKEGEKFTSKDDIVVGAEVVVKGKIKKYNTTYEMDKNNHLVSYTASTKITATIEFEYDGTLTEGNTDVISIVYNGDGVMTANSTDTEVATVALEGTTLTVTAVAAGATTISVSAPETEVYSAAIKSYTLMVKETPKPAALPFSFNGGRSDVGSTQGMSYEGLGNDYSSQPKLKFDSSEDNVIIFFNGQASAVSYTIKGNGSGSDSWDGTFDVMESANGSDYTSVASYTELEGTATTKTDNIKSDTRYIKFVYTNKILGNVALGAINIFRGRTVTIPGEAASEEDCGMTTLYLDYATAVPAECKAYYAGSVSECQVNLVKAQNYVTANQGVLVYGKKGASFTFAETAEEVEAPDANMFVGSTTTSETPCVAADNIFYLSTDGTFKQLIDGTRKAYKAYLNTEVAPSTKGFTVNFNDETAINEVSGFESQVPSGKLLENGRVVIIKNNTKYNVAGQRIK